MYLVITIVILLAAAALGFVLTAILEGYFEVKNKPREPMEWCHKHGTYRRGHCLPIAGILACPSCYREALKGPKK